MVILLTNIIYPDYCDIFVAILTVIIKVFLSVTTFPNPNSLIFSTHYFNSPRSFRHIKYGTYFAKRIILHIL